METPRAAINKEGYINDQNALKDIPFGATSLGDKGCGFVAVYNILKRLKYQFNPQHLYNFFLKTTFFKGKFGISIVQLIVYLIGKKIFKGISFWPNGYKDIDIGILWYKHSTGRHYIAFYKKGNGYIFLNAGLDGETPITFEEFLYKYNVSCLTCVIKVGAPTCAKED